MNILELEQKWNSVRHTGISTFRSILISATSIPELYIGIDINGNRHLILKVPDYVNLNCANLKMAHLSLEWHKDTKLLFVGLVSRQFADLFNELTLSIYNRVRNISNPDQYTKEFIESFYKWTEFFTDSTSNILSELELKGIFGELLVLKWYLNNCKNISTNEILSAWQGPYNKAQDFIFPSFNHEIKTKNQDDLIIHISSEYQLESEFDKVIKLGIVDLVSIGEGQNIQELVNEIRNIVLNKGADLTLFLKPLAKSGLGGSNPEKYINFRYKPLLLVNYDCQSCDFPKIIKSKIPSGMSRIEYCLNVGVLTSFIIERIEL